jgi:HEAT repeat protein
MGDRAGASALTHWADFGFAGRISAMKLCGQLHFAPALPILKRLLRDPDWSLRAAAADALGALGDSQVRLDGVLARERHPYVQTRLRAAIDVFRSPSSMDRSP